MTTKLDGPEFIKMLEIAHQTYVRVSDAYMKMGAPLPVWRVVAALVVIGEVVEELDGTADKVMDEVLADIKAIARHVHEPTRALREQVDASLRGKA